MIKDGSVQLQFSGRIKPTAPPSRPQQQTQSIKIERRKGKQKMDQTRERRGTRLIRKNARYTTSDERRMKTVKRGVNESGGGLCAGGLRDCFSLLCLCLSLSLSLNTPASSKRKVFFLFSTRRTDRSPLLTHQYSRDQSEPGNCCSITTPMPQPPAQSGLADQYVRICNLQRSLLVAIGDELP